MNTYLTYRSKENPVWEIVVMGICVLFTIIAVSVFLEPYEHEDLLIEFLAEVLFLAMFVVPFALILRRRLRRRFARIFARCFDDMREETFPIEQLQGKVRIRAPERTLDRLIQKGFIENVELDLATHEVTLTAASPGMKRESRYITVKCPHCGASSRVPSGKEVRCGFCDQLICPDVTARKA